MKRILFILDYLYSDAGGGTEKQFLMLYGKSSKIGIEPYITFLLDAEIHHKLSWKNTPTILNVKSLLSMQFIFAFISLLRFIRDQHIKTIHTMYDDSGIVGYFLSLLVPDLKIIMSLRNMGHEHHGLKKLIMSIVFRKADIMTVNSKSIKNKLISDYRVDSDNIRVIYNFIKDKEEPNALNTPDSKFLDIRNNHKHLGVVVSNLRDVKGIDAIIEAVNSIKNNIDIGIIIIGEGEQRDKYQNMIDTYGLQNNIYLVGYQNQVEEILQICDICILASLSEGLSNALIEYAFMGKPIIATDVGGNPEILDHGKCGILIKPNDSNSLANEIIKLTSDPDLCRLYSEQILEYSKNMFSEEKAINIYKEIYS